MQFQVVIIFAILTLTYAQVSQSPEYKNKYPETYKYAKIARHPPEVNRDNVEYRQILKQLDKGGFEQDIFNDTQGTSEDKAYGTRELRQNASITYLGGVKYWPSVKKNT